VSVKRPQVTLKLATSLDGRIALSNGVSKWITGPEARGEVHKLRAQHDVMLTGIGTILADNPQLTARPDGMPCATQPRRAVMDSQARTPADGAFVRAGPVTIFHTTETPSPTLAAAGAKLVRLSPMGEGKACLVEALSWLAGQGAARVMIEAGGTLAASAIAAGVVDRIEWFRAPVLLGGDSIPAIAALGLESLDQPPTFERIRVRECGRDLWESWERS
jgi:diaminohydroxyphosphoribosylaminopyrimidine deaminase/5-amino-6-(5-phosphoribosylamino)uracil reductase